MTALTPVGDTKRCAGRWIVWSKIVSTPIVEGGKLTRYEPQKKYYYGRVKRKYGQILVTEQHDNVHTNAAWFADEMPWPKYEWGSYKTLSPEEADAILYPKEQPT